MAPQLTGVTPPSAAPPVLAASRSSGEQLHASPPADSVRVTQKGPFGGAHAQNLPEGPSVVPPTQLPQALESPWSQTLN